MSMDFVFGVLSRAGPRPGSLSFRRRVEKSDRSAQTREESLEKRRESPPPPGARLIDESV